MNYSTPHFVVSIDSIEYVYACSVSVATREYWYTHLLGNILQPYNQDYSCISTFLIQSIHGCYSINIKESMRITVCFIPSMLGALAQNCIAGLDLTLYPEP